jgi:hypothetical protein
MRQTLILPLLFAGLSLAAAPAWAQTEDEKILEQESARTDAERQPPIDDEMDDAELDERVFYSGMGIARASSEFQNLGDAINLDVVLGFRIPTAPWFGLEIDIGQTIIPGENKGPPDPGSPGTPDVNCPGPLCVPGTPPTPPENGTNDPDEFGMQALGISAVLKSPGRFYVTGRYGYRYIATSIEELNEKRSSNGVGFGLGYRWGKGLSGVELTYKELAEDVDSVGLTFFIRTANR